MTDAGLTELLSPPLAKAIAKKGFASLTSVQLAVLERHAKDRDLRITSQTGSGKTVAIGIALAEFVAPVAPPPGETRALPRALVIVPTRELARQVEDELRWLYADLGARVASLTGGASIRDELRALAAGPPVIVGTPGRVVDHLERGSLDPAGLRAVVLDEADRLLDMGFRDELEAILASVPEGHRTHLVSATFPADVRKLADRVQSNAVHVEGTKLGAANVDIDHVVYLVDPNQVLDALINVLLAHPDARTLVFVETRIGVGEVAAELSRVGFGVASISGDLEQRERTKALAAFRGGRVRVLVATDVAARGIDVEDVALVVQFDPPSDADAFTHRSGRTGRAGKKGKSALLLVPRALAMARRVAERAKVNLRIEPLPTADAIRRFAEDRLITDLARDNAAPIDDRTAKLAQRVLAAVPASLAVARLLSGARLVEEAEPREVTMIVPPAPRSRPSRPGTAERGERPERRERPAPVERKAHVERPAPAHRTEYAERPSPVERKQHVDRPAPVERKEHAERPALAERTERVDPRKLPERAPGPKKEDTRGFIPFLVTWGSLHGADARRLLAMICRRGGVERQDVGAIDVRPTASIVQIEASVADRFAEAAGARDPRDPKVRIVRDGEGRDARERPRADAPRRPLPKGRPMAGKPARR